ncbi:MAG: hypothetical protein F6J97_25035 [Leptolyngbya sp. SIO4C1]|nr:hypothetical protein [Leptolyngbya sp. SIO4C1]
MLELVTSIDLPGLEQAEALGELDFALFGRTGTSETPMLLDAFNLFGRLDTPGENDELSIQASSNVSLLGQQSFLASSSDGLDETAIAVVQGFYSQSFDQATTLTLVEFKRSEARASAQVSTPETSSVVALLLVGGAIFGVSQRRWQTA